MSETFDAIILGAGAAGLMCAMEGGRRGRRVVLLERATRPGKKILISGGGRCNFTNLHCKPENFLSANPHFARSALARYTPADFLELVEKHGIAWHEKTLGQLFCDGSAQQIVTMLVTECAQAGVALRLDQHITAVDHHNGSFTVSTSAGQRYTAPTLVVATGGLSIPKMGATAFGHELARQFGHSLVAPRPALVPLLFAPAQAAQFTSLAGISTEVVASIGRQHFREKLLITHRGLSGPAILQISSYWLAQGPVTLDLAPAQQLLATHGQPRSASDLRALLRKVFPQRLADRLLHLHPPAGWSNHALAEWETSLHRWSFTPAGTEGYEKAEVTAGGVDTAQLSATTMESRLLPGLYFIGEVIDVTGHLGGFNFQWAWASGAAAGRAL